jgi:hypothetical protein
MLPALVKEALQAEIEIIRGENEKCKNKIKPLKEMLETMRENATLALKLYLDKRAGSLSNTLSSEETQPFLDNEKQILLAIDYINETIDQNSDQMFWNDEAIFLLTYPLSAKYVDMDSLNVLIEFCDKSATVEYMVHEMEKAKTGVKKENPTDAVNEKLIFPKVTRGKIVMTEAEAKANAIFMERSKKDCLGLHEEIDKIREKIKSRCCPDLDGGETSFSKMLEHMAEWREKHTSSGLKNSSSSLQTLFNRFIGNTPPPSPPPSKSSAPPHGTLPRKNKF